MFKLMCENIYGMMAVSPKALKGNVITKLIYYYYIIFDYYFLSEYCHSKIKKIQNLNLQSTQNIGIGVPAVMKSHHPECYYFHKVI